MGYRLEISKVEYCDCGGKLFGYIDEENLVKCKSWQWLKRKGYFDDIDGYTNNDYALAWDYNVRHQCVLYHDEFAEFIKLYIEDKKKYGNYHQFGECLEDYKKSLEADWVLIEWV